MTEYEIASAIQNYVTSHAGVTDSPISIRQIRDEVDTLRLRLLDEMYAQNNTFVDYGAYTQLLTAPTVIENKKAVAEIPAIYYDPSGKIMVTFLGSSTGDTPFKVIGGSRRIWAKFDTYTGSVPTGIYHNGKMTLENVAPEAIFMEAIFDKPSSLSKYGYDWKKSRYPVPQGVIDLIIGKTAESYIRTRVPQLPRPNTQSDEDVQGIQQVKQA